MRGIARTGDGLAWDQAGVDENRREFECFIDGMER
jgi:hypothetical protein